MFCRNCGNKLGDTDFFCQNCGTAIESKEENKAATEIEKTMNEEANTDTECDSSLNSSENTVEPESEKRSKSKPFMRIATAISALGLLIFVGIVAVSLIGWGEVYIFGGYEFTAILAAISMVLMLIGVLGVGVVFLIRVIKKVRPLFSSKKGLVFTTIILVLSLLCSSWGFIDYANENRSSSSGTSGKMITLMDAYIANNCMSPYATFGGSYIKIDTNPYDADGDSSNASTYASKALSAIIGINSTLGFPSYVYQDMIGTRALDGRQTYTGGRFSASWRYHPDSGLEVMYTQN